MPKKCYLLLVAFCGVSHVLYNAQKQNDQKLLLEIRNPECDMATCLNLLRQKASPTARDQSHNSPLHLAAMHVNRSPKLCALLLNAKADIAAENSFGNIPLHYAALNIETDQDFETYETLLQAGSPTHKRNTSKKAPTDYLSPQYRKRSRDLEERLTPWLRYTAKKILIDADIWFQHHTQFTKDGTP